MEMTQHSEKQWRFTTLGRPTDTNQLTLYKSVITGLWDFEIQQSIQFPTLTSPQKMDKKLLLLNIPNFIKCILIVVSSNRFLPLLVVLSPHNIGHLCFMMQSHKSWKLTQLAHFKRHHLMLLLNEVCDPDMIQNHFTFGASKLMSDNSGLILDSDSASFCISTAVCLKIVHTKH